MYSQSPSQSSVSVNTTTTTTSQSPMLSKQQPKQYDVSFAQLSSQYGLSGGVIPAPSTSLSPTSSTSKAAPPNLNRWENAYAQLSGQYGFGSTVPTPSLPPKSKPSAPQTSHSQKHNGTANPPCSDLNRWETAYANLSGQYGFGGAVPVPSLPSKEKGKAMDAVKEAKRRFGLGLPSLSSRK